jgi:hypothetical protein
MQSQQLTDFSNPTLKAAIKLSKEQSKTNSVAWVRERTIPTERPQLVGEVSANFCGQKGVA